MTSMDSELNSLESMYGELEAGLDRQYQSILGGSPPDPMEDRKTARLEQPLGDAETRIARLVKERGSVVDDGGKTKCRAAELRKRAQSLTCLIERNMEQCRQFQAATRDALQELDRGTRYLDSVREKSKNQPKFIDSRE